MSKRPRKLLLVDESVTIGRVVEMTFTGGDVQVIAVGNRREAMDRILLEQPDIVLADVGLDAPDGYELAAYVKGDPRLGHVPVLLLTGAFQPIDEARAARCGCDGVLAKPFDVQSMQETVTGLLDSPKVDDAPDVEVVAVEEPAAVPTDAGPVSAAPVALVVAGAPVVAEAPPVAAAAIDTLGALLEAFMAAAPAPAEEPAVALCAGDACAAAELASPALQTAAVAAGEPAGVPPPQSADGSHAEERDASLLLADCLERLSAGMHVGAMTESGVAGCDADLAIDTAALSLDDYFDLVDEVLARSREAAASGGAPCEIPPFHPDPQR